jgi:hypothetical protein
MTNPTHRIVWKDDQWTVLRSSDQTHHKSKGKTTWKPVSYHLYLDHAVYWCLQRDLGESLGSATDLAAIRGILRDYREDLAEFTKELLADPPEAE